MGDNRLKEKIIALALDTTGAELSEEESLKESGIDSLTLVALVVAIEEEFGFSFSDDDLQPENLQTLAALISLTEKYL